ncbi:MAG TPA: c-type cytochrome [Acidimicrobiales bacterium]|jgi:mono/diheme cytochrome c family protein|nr:c-type cytochrome [Acidimicrobiales bacterium]
MVHLISTVLAASTVKSIGAVICALTVIGFLWYVAVNIRAGRAEVGSEIELAPNRKPYYDDEGLEGPRLTRVLSTGLMLLALVAVGLPLYWLNEPGRQDGAVKMFDQTFVNRGAALFAPTAEGGYNCAGCHGAEGVGGNAAYTLSDGDNKFVASVSWQAPALNTVLLRYSEEEVRQILIYGRPGTPMPAWGAEGGGPLTTQQIDELIAYLSSIQLSSDEAKTQAEEALRKDLGLEDGAPIDYTDPATGEAIFNLGLSNATAGGAFSCARCHTKGASIIEGSQQPADADLSDYKGFAAGSGAFGFNLTDGVVPRQFLTIDALIEFLHKGSEFGMLYGQRGQGSGRMPGFGDNPNTEDDETDGMFTDGMLRAVALYEASLGEGDAAAGQGGTASTTTTTPPSGGPGASSTTTTTKGT